MRCRLSVKDLGCTIKVNNKNIMGKHDRWGEQKTENFYQRWTPTGLRLLKERAAEQSMSTDDYLESKVREPDLDLISHHQEMIELHEAEIKRLEDECDRRREHIEYHRSVLDKLQ